MYKTSGKRFFDLVMIFSGSLFLLPVFLIILIVLFAHHKGNPFFFQQRPGLNEKIFTLVKFKTMCDKTDKYNNPLPDHQRITSIGRFIRNTSLDELPQLWNVLKGDMSIVGPRPLLIEYLPMYNPAHKKRHHVRPGITGWAQTHGRNAIDWEKKFDLDLWYVENVSFFVDFKILLLTVRQIISMRDIDMTNPDVAKKFQG